MIHNLFVDSLHGSEFLSLIVGRTILSVYHLLGNIKGEASYNVPVAISIVLDDILGESAFQKFHFLKRVYRFGTKSLFQVLIQYLPEFRQACISHYGHSILMSLLQAAQVVFAPAQFLLHEDGCADIAERKIGLAFPEDGVEIFF